VLIDARAVRDGGGGDAEAEADAHHPGEEGHRAGHLEHRIERSGHERRKDRRATQPGVLAAP